jgi:hypothetical protein
MIVSCIRIPGYIWPKAGDLGKSDDSALVRLFVHGGGYMMGNGSESFGECGMRLYYYTLLYCVIYSFFSLFGVERVDMGTSSIL